MKDEPLKNVIMTTQIRDEMFWNTRQENFLLYSQNNFLVKYSKKCSFYFESKNKLWDHTTDYNKNDGLIECNNKLCKSYDWHKNEE